jgi:hypothetical protein
MWDVNRDVESALFDIERDNYQLFWDSKGSPYITSENRTLIAQQGVQLTFYDVEDINLRDKAKQNRTEFGSEYGHCFDSKFHNWVYLSDYISLSHSYMTFVIQSSTKFLENFVQEEIGGEEENYFDLEAYNYMLNRRTLFTDSFFQDTKDESSLANNHVLMQNVLT